MWGGGELLKQCHQNSAFNESFYQVNKDIILKFPDACIDYILVGFHTWNDTDKTKWNTESSFIIKNKIKEIIKSTPSFIMFSVFVDTDFKIDNHTVLLANSRKLPNNDFTPKLDFICEMIDYTNVISIFFGKRR